jgi:hypothetical protein
MKPDTVMTKTEFHGRKRLPGHRRPHELIDFVHDGFLYTVGIGRFADGRLAEIFINAGIAGTAIETYARDVPITIGLLVQLGCPPENSPCAHPQPRWEGCRAARHSARYLDRDYSSANTLKKGERT